MKHIKTFSKLFENLQNLDSSIILDSVELSEEYDQLKKLGWIDINITDTYIEFRNYHLENPRDLKFPIFRIYMSVLNMGLVTDKTYKLAIWISKDSKPMGIKIDKDSSNILPPHKTSDAIEFEKATGTSMDMFSEHLKYYNDYISKIKGLINFTNSPEFDDIKEYINLSNTIPSILRKYDMSQEEFDDPNYKKHIDNKLHNVADRIRGDFDFLKNNPNIGHEKLEDILDRLKNEYKLGNSEIEELIDIALENKDYDRIKILQKYLK